MSTGIIMPCINANADSTGTGVRVSIYIQAFLNLVCALIFAKDGRISNRKTILTRGSASFFTFFTGFSLLTITFVQAAARTQYSLSVYHSLIVLNLSWIIILSTASYLIVAFVNSLLDSAIPGSGRVSSPARYDRSDEADTRSVLYPSVVYLSAMGASGFQVWSKINTFGSQTECIPRTFLTFLGHNMLVTRPSLRTASLAIYSLAAFPFANIGVIIILGVFGAGILYLLFIRTIAALPKRMEPRGRNRFLLMSAIIVIFFLEVLLIVDTELMISRSTVLVKESQMPLGSPHVMLMCIRPLAATVEALYNSWNEPGRGMWRDEKRPTHPHNIQGPNNTTPLFSWHHKPLHRTITQVQV